MQKQPRPLLLDAAALSPRLQDALLQRTPRSEAAVESICPPDPSIPLHWPGAGLLVWLVITVAALVLWGVVGVLFVVVLVGATLALVMSRAVDAGASARERALARDGVLTTGRVVFTNEVSECLHEVVIAYDDPTGIEQRTQVSGGGALRRLAPGMLVPLLVSPRYHDVAGVILRERGLILDIM